MKIKPSSVFILNSFLIKPFHAFKRKGHLWKYSWALKYSWIVWTVELLFLLLTLHIIHKCVPPEVEITWENQILQPNKQIRENLKLKSLVSMARSVSEEIQALFLVPPNCFVELGYFLLFKSTLRSWVKNEVSMVCISVLLSEGRNFYLMNVHSARQEAWFFCCVLLFIKKIDPQASLSNHRGIWMENFYRQQLFSRFSEIYEEN